MNKVSVIIKDGKLDFDFEGFPGNTCSDEEKIIRVLFEKVGVRTDVEHSDNKGEGEAGGIAESEKLRH